MVMINICLVCVFGVVHIHVYTHVAVCIYLHAGVHGYVDLCLQREDIVSSSSFSTLVFCLFVCLFVF